MADQQLRRLDRDASGGDLHARVELIANRLRNGELSRRRASLAAFLGDEAAAAALGQVDEPQPVPAGPVEAHRDVRRWLADVGAYGQDVSVRVTLALATPTLEVCDVPGERRAARLALDTASEWLSRPSNGQQIVCQRAGDLATTTAADSSPSMGPRPASYHALTACGLAAYAASSAVSSAAADGCFGCARHATLALVGAGTLQPSKTQAGKVLHPDLRARIEQELIAWAID